MLTIRARPHWMFLGFSICMFFAILTDLALSLLDAVLMSSPAPLLASFLHLGHKLSVYQSYWHYKITLALDAFTVFLVVEFHIRWIGAIITRRYVRWFYFPFVHWPQALGSLPQFRILRLWHGASIAYHLYHLGILVLPKKWLLGVAFYYQKAMNLVSDQVVLYALRNAKKRIASMDMHAFGRAICQKMQPDLAPVMRHYRHQASYALDAHIARLTPRITQSVQEAVSASIRQNPELMRYVRAVPLVGGALEEQILTLSAKMADKIVKHVLITLADDDPAAFAKDLLIADEADINALKDAALTFIDALIDSLKDTLPLSTDHHKETL